MSNSMIYQINKVLFSYANRQINEKVCAGLRSTLLKQLAIRLYKEALYLWKFISYRTFKSKVIIRISLSTIAVEDLDAFCAEYNAIGERVTRDFGCSGIVPLIL